MSLRSVTLWTGSGIMMPIRFKGRQPGLVLAVPMVLTWAYILAGAGTGMNVWAMTTSQLPPPLDLPHMMANWSMSYALAMIGMWWSMMLAMMLPGTMLQIIGPTFRATRHPFLFRTG